MLSAAYAAIASAPVGRLPEMIAHMHRRVSDVIGGQHADLESDCTTIAEYNEIARMKSGPLLGLPVELCLIAADRPAHVSAAMAASDAIAIAYQTTDDISDAERDTEAGGLNFLSIVQGDMKSRVQAAHLHAREYAQAAIAIAKTLPDGSGNGLIALTKKFIPVRQSLKLHEPCSHHRWRICIAAALRMRAKGYDVTVFDRCSRLGGRAQIFERDGFRYDAGPTVITAPFLFDELFALFGKDIRDYVAIVPLDTWYQFRYPDGDIFNYGGTVEDTVREVRRISPEDEAGYLSLLDESRRIYKVGYERLADQPFHSFWEMAKIIPQMLTLGVRRSVWDLVSSHLKHDKLRQAFSVQPLLVGGNPFDTTCIYNLIHFLERASWRAFRAG